jgi:N-acetyltransferase
MKLAARPLANAWVRLEPLAEPHREALRRACDADPDTWAQLYPFSMSGDHFDGGWTKLRHDVAESRKLMFAVICEAACVGMTGYIDPDPANRTVEIGATYYRPDQRGGSVNPAAKRLLLDEAFEAGARRVAFKVDAINARSRAAVLKLGATQEAVLRQDRVTWTGRIRDTVIFSILAEEWPAVRKRLDARLAS